MNSSKTTHCVWQSDNMGGWKLNEPIPAPHSDPSPQAAVISSRCVQFTAVEQPVYGVT